MPEGPEVKRLTVRVNNIVNQSKLKNVIINSGRYSKKLPTNFEKFKSSLPLIVKSVNCHGKFIWWEFLDNNGDSDHVMFNTLGMTGYWTKEDNLKHKKVPSEIRKLIQLRRCELKWTQKDLAQRTNLQVTIINEIDLFVEK